MKKFPMSGMFTLFSMLTGKTFKSRYQERLMIAGVVATAVFFRLYRLEDLMVFSGETNNLLYYIEAYLAGEKPLLLGLEAAQYVHHLFHLPWYLWMMIPIYFLGGGNPLVFSVFQAVIGAFGSYLLWKIGLMLGSKRLGILAALGYATLFRFSMMERFVSPVSLVSFGVITLIYLGLKARQRQNYLNFFWLGLWTGISISFHYAMLLSAGMILGWMLWKHKKYFWSSLGGIVLGFSPLLIFDLRHGFFNLTGLWYVGKSLFNSTRPYGSSHFVYQIYPVVTVLIASIISRLPGKYIYFSVIMFVIFQSIQLINFKIHPNFADRERTVQQVLNQLNSNTSVYFQDESSFDYAYLLRWEGKHRGMDSRNIVIYEPWQPENNAKVVVSENGALVYSRE